MKAFRFGDIGKAKKGNHPGEAQVRTGRRNVFYKKGLLGEPHEEAEIQCKAMKRGKNLALSKHICSEKERVPSKVTQSKVVVGLKRWGS